MWALSAAIPLTFALFLLQMINVKIWKTSFQLKLDHPATYVTGIGGFIGTVLAFGANSQFGGVLGGICLGYFGGLLLGFFMGYVDETFEETTAY